MADSPDGKQQQAAPAAVTRAGWDRLPVEVQKMIMQSRTGCTTYFQQ